MRYHCFCGFAGNLEETEIYEGVEAYMIHCPKCDKLLVEHYYSEMEEELEGLRQAEQDVLEEILPNDDQCRYLTHLCNKQIAKLDRAKEQLLDLMDKAKVMQEILEKYKEEK